MDWVVKTLKTELPLWQFLVGAFVVGIIRNVLAFVF